MSEQMEKEQVKEVEAQEWGRVLICGGMGWATNGKKERNANTSTDLLAPHILRSLCNVKITKLVTGPSANYAVVIDIHGAAYLFGRSPSPSLASASDPSSVGGVISEHVPVKIAPSSVGLAKSVKWVSGAAGRGHVLLLDSEGGVWGCGNNVVGQVGLPVSAMVANFTRVTGPWMKDSSTRIVQVTAGHTFSLFLTSTGQIYASGSSECGQLGNGKTGERIVKAGKTAYDVEVPPRLVQGLEKKNIVEIASGNQHSLARDEDGYVYAWGYAGYSRLGLQDQKDRLVPTLVPHFAGGPLATRARSILCGPTNSVVINQQKVLFMAGKWKITGDGSLGSPYTYFKNIQEIVSCKVMKASCGGCTHFLTTPDPAGRIMTVGYGQGVLYGELGLGSEGGKSATKPVKIESLSGIDVIDVAGGAFFSLFLAKPNAVLSDIPRWPVQIESPSICIGCNEDRKGEDPLECEKCDSPYHLSCLDPPLEGIPEGEWFCPECTKEADAAPEDEFRPANGDGGAKKKKPRPSASATNNIQAKEETPKKEDTPARSVTPATGIKRKAESSTPGSSHKKR